MADDDEPGIEGRAYFSPIRSTFASGMHAAIVETDPQTAEVTILRYCVVHDCGPLINPQIVEGQIHGGVAQGVGGALYERMVYDETGQLLNASFMDFLMPYVSEVPRQIEIDHLETPSPLNPLGDQGRRRGRGHPRRRGARRRDRGCRGHPDPVHADIAVGPVRAPPAPAAERLASEQEAVVKLSGTATMHAPPTRTSGPR